MRSTTLFTAALLALALRARNATGAPSPVPEVAAAGSRTFGGHTFMFPATIDTSFHATMLGTRTSVRHEGYSDLPIGGRSFDITSLGVRENVDFEIAIDDRWAVGLGLQGQAKSGTTGRALVTAGAQYAYGASLTGALRIARIESTHTQLALRAELFGVQGGGQIELGPFLRAVREDPTRTLSELVGNVGGYIVTPGSAIGAAASINAAQTLTAALSLQASFRLDLRRITRSPFVAGRGRVDEETTDLLPRGGVAFGVNPPGSPVSFLAEYRVSAQNTADPTSFARHTLGLGVYYSGRSDLQVGPVVFGEFGLPALHGIDANGNPTGSERGTAFSGQFMMRYIW